jgi:hypothetical protein
VFSAGNALHMLFCTLDFALEANLKCVSPFKDCFKEVIHIRLDELLRVLKSVMHKHQNLNSADLQNAAEVLTAKVKGKEDAWRVAAVGRGSF